MIIGAPHPILISLFLPIVGLIWMYISIFVVCTLMSDAKRVNSPLLLGSNWLKAEKAPFTIN